MKSIKIIFICSGMVLFSFGCAHFSKWVDETTKDIQQRYGNSKYWKENEGDVVDKLSGYKRIEGKANYYNKSGITLGVGWIGVIANGDSKSYAWECNCNTNTQVNNSDKETLYEIDDGVKNINRIIVLYKDRYEIR